MTPFLRHVADNLLKACAEEGIELSRVAVVFPNKRASLFLSEYLMQAAEEQQGGGDCTLWAPRYLTISELFSQLTDLVLADKVETVCRLYKIYASKVEDAESLDFFFGWGERLLADFDDVDKNMADAERLFRNMNDLQQLENTDYIDDEQERVIQQFFADFNRENLARIQERFKALWNVLLPTYASLRRSMADEGKAYEGALYRAAIERIQDGTASWDPAIERYAFVGFNVLDKVEETLFRHLQDEGKAWFYWDYDELYINADTITPSDGSDGLFEAGLFLNRNLHNFPNRLPAHLFRNFLENKEIEYVKAATEHSQVHFATDWLVDNLTENERETAVVLCNEALLQPMLHTLPDEVHEANITKGYPLHHTSAYAIVERAMRHEVTDGRAWLHRLTVRIKEEAAKLTRADENSAQSEHEAQPSATKEFEHILNTEALFQIFLTLQTFAKLIDDGWLEVSPTTLQKLLIQVLRQKSVAFHGEPATGLQIMGVLETRCLDFRHLLMLSVGEGFLPGKVRDQSFIPYMLRREFGLTTPHRKIAVFAYYFYRLLQRAEKVTLVYNGTSGGARVGEMSRFMSQLLIETSLPVRRISLTNEQKFFMFGPRPIRKPTDLVERLARNGKSNGASDSVPRLSPSVINAYLRCQLQFFFQYVAHIEAPQAEDPIVESNTLGTIFHRAAELTYDHLSQQNGGYVTPAMLNEILDPSNLRLEHFMRVAMEENGVSTNDIVATIVRGFMRNLLQHDIGLGTFQYVNSEEHVGVEITMGSDCAAPRVYLHGTIDRQDHVTSADSNRPILRILDYKTGGESEKAESLDSLFVEAKAHPHYTLQTFIYSYIQHLLHPEEQIKPALFFVHRSAVSTYTPDVTLAQKTVDDFAPLASEFEKRLKDLIAQMLRPDEPFRPTSVSDRCRTCTFASLCNVQ